MSGGNWKDMFQAACEGDLPRVEYHISSGVDVNYVHPEILGTALVGSIMAKQESVALFLLEHGADPDLRSDFEGLTPIQAAREAVLGRVEARLMELGASEPASGSGAPRSTPNSWLMRLLKWRRTSSHG